MLVQTSSNVNLYIPALPHYISYFQEINYLISQSFYIFNNIMCLIKSILLSNNFKFFYVILTFEHLIWLMYECFLQLLTEVVEIHFQICLMISTNVPWNCIDDENKFCRYDGHQIFEIESPVCVTLLRFVFAIKVPFG